MGLQIADTITVMTSTGSLTIQTDKIKKIEVADDLGTNITFIQDSIEIEALTLESFLRVLSYFCKR
jgi:hypothetical protein